MARSRRSHSPIDAATVATRRIPDNSEAVVRVQKAIEQLPASGREVILLHYFSGLTYEEISQALGITPQSVQGRLQRARGALKQQLAQAAE
jgi:RNA polymerase sigma-70 factor, ECF subfamily